MTRKFLVVVTAFAVFFCVACTGAPEQAKEVENQIPSSPDNNVTSTDTDAAPEANLGKTANLGEFADWHDDLPAKYTNFTETKIDIDGDKTQDVLVTYVDQNVVRKAGDIRTIKYLKVFRKNGDIWQKVKEDEVTQRGGTVEMDYCLLEKVNAGADAQEEVLVSKCSQNGELNGYYLFGRPDHRVFEDFAIPRGYLHNLPETRPGENKPSLRTVKVDGKGIYETYDITCESREQERFNSSGTQEVACREVTLFLAFKEDMIDGFADPIMRSENTLIQTKKTDFDYIGAKFDRPYWLEPILDPGNSIVYLRNQQNEVYKLHFGKNFEALSGIMPAFHSFPILDSDKSPTATDISMLLDGVYEHCTAPESWPGKIIYSTQNGNTVTTKVDDNYLHMVRLFPGSRGSLTIEFESKNRKLNYSDEAVMKKILESFEFVK